MFGAYGRSMETNSIIFVSQSASENKVLDKLTLRKKIVPIENTRNISKKSMKLNNLCPEIKVDPETYEVRLNGELITCEPAKELPMAQRYFLY